MKQWDLWKIKLEDYKGKWLILFSHPEDFIPVCTTERIAFTRMYSYFKNLNTELLGLSVDSNLTHEVVLNLPTKVRQAITCNWQKT